MIGQRILVLAPHPDDETVGCAAAIGRVRARGARVYVLFLTTGVPPDERRRRQDRYASRVERRQAEALGAAARLGIEPARFLACPARRLRTALAETHRAIRVELGRVQADALWAPAYEGGHQDHDVASFLASRFARSVPVIEFSEYNNAARVKLNEFPTSLGIEDVVSLSPTERASKRGLLALYRSERGNLRHVRLEREVFRPQATYDYRRRPHGGRLFYERFQWIPFRHARVDFTRPEEVCATLSAAAPSLTADAPPATRAER